MRLLGILTVCAALAGAASNDTFLIKDADVYPVTSAPQKGVSVLVKDGKIAEIGPKLVAPKGIKVVEAKGLRVYPGMIDSATQLGLSEVPAVRETVDTGELGELMPQLRALASVNPDSELFGVARVNGITSAMTFPSAGRGGGGRGAGAAQLISGQAALIHTSGWTWEDMAVRPSAAVCVQFPSLGGRGGRGGAIPEEILQMLGEAGAAGGYTQQLRTYQQQISKLSDFFEEARRYQKAKSAHEPGFEPDLKYEAMLPVLERKTPLAVSVSSPRTIHDAIAFAEKQNVKIVLLQPRELGTAAEELKAKNVPVILGKVLELPHAEDDPYDEAFTLPAEVYKAGIKFAFGTFENEFIRNLPYQAATAVAFGLPQEEALKAVTINPAEIWGVSDQVGSIEKGKTADLVVTTGDPLEIQTQVKHLYVAGKEVELTNKQTQLYERYSNR
ncbi:MAG TPA: amidohydrolase family protein [Bryobacteraceae bacterium]|nr:amidohydrolase family protein [Bryobacteraceae bacterium]